LAARCGADHVLIVVRCDESVAVARLRAQVGHTGDDVVAVRQKMTAACERVDEPHRTIDTTQGGTTVHAAVDELLASLTQSPAPCDGTP